MIPDARPRPVVLCILDGWGHSDASEDNAIRQARTPTLDRLYASCPQALIDASEHEVGLPEGQMGNSEVGHMNIGAGRIVLQDLPRIDQAVRSGEIESNPALRELHREAQGLRRDGPGDGPDVARRRACPPGPDRRPLPDPGRGRPAGEGPRLPRRPRHAAVAAPGATLRTSLRRPGGGGRHGQRPLLRHGPRQALGPGRTRLPRPGLGRGRGGGRSAGRHRRQLCAGGQRRVRRTGGDRRLSGHGRRRRRADGELSVPTGRERSWLPCSTPPSTASTGIAWSASPRRRAWSSTPRRTIAGSTPCSRR